MVKNSCCKVRVCVCAYTTGGVYGQTVRTCPLLEFTIMTQEFP